MTLRIFVDDNQINGAVFIIENNGRDNRLTPDKPLHGCTEEEIVDYAKDYVQWVTRQEVGYYEVEYAEES